MLIEDRKSQVFPTFTPHQLEFAARFASGPAKAFGAGENIFNVGDRDAGIWLVAKGGIIATRRDGLGREELFATCGPGKFSGEVSELGGQASLVEETVDLLMLNLLPFRACSTSTGKR